MAYLLQVLSLLFALAASPAFAGYAQLKPPPGWSQGMGAAVPGQAGFFNYGAAANGAVLKGTSVLTNASLTVAGQTVIVPASLRLAANAAIFAAPYLFTNPWLAVAVGVAAWIGSADISWDASLQKWVQPQKSIDLYCKLTTSQRSAYNGFLSSLSGTGAYGVPHTVSETLSHENGVCKYGAKQVAKQWDGTVRESQNHWSDIPEQKNVAVTLKPLSKEEFERELNPSVYPGRVMPDTLPRELDIPLPVTPPVVNPDPSINPLPLPSPALVPRPLFVPTGNPLPTADPNVWNQPGVRVTPSPTVDDPWRVDVQPENIPQNNPNPKSPNELNPPLPIPGTPVLSNPEAGLGLCDQYPGIAACAPAGDQNPKPEEIKDFCKENPTVLACQKLGDLTPEPLQTKTVPLAINQDAGWNLASASCPAPKTVVLSGKTYSFGIAAICDFASGIRPLVVGFAWITAILGFIGLSRKD